MRFEDVPELSDLYRVLNIKMSMQDLKELLFVVLKGVGLLTLLSSDLDRTEWEGASSLHTMDYRLLPDCTHGSSTASEWMSDNILKDMSLLGNPVSWKQEPLHDKLCSMSVEQAQKIADLITTFVNFVVPRHQHTIALGFNKTVIGSPAFHCEQFESIVPKIDFSMKDFVRLFYKKIIENHGDKKIIENHGGSSKNDESLISNPLFIPVIVLGCILIAVCLYVYVKR